MALTVPEAARRAGRNPETIRRWIWQGRLRATKIGNQHFVEPEDLDAAAAGRPPVDLELERQRKALRELLALRQRLEREGKLLPEGTIAAMIDDDRNSH